MVSTLSETIAHYKVAVCADARPNQLLGYRPMPSTLEPTVGWIVAERREPPGQSLVFRSVIPDGLRRSATKETALGVGQRPRDATRAARKS